MWLLPHGSFNPTEFGFYYAILVGISTSYLVVPEEQLKYFFIKKLQSKIKVISLI
jgi:hypothetical protein